MSETPKGDSSPSAAAPQTGRFPRIVHQLTGIAAVGLVIGLATVIVPLAFHRVLYVLPIAGLLAGVQAIRGGQPIGGIIAVVLNALGGTFTLIGVRG